MESNLLLGESSVSSFKELATFATAEPIILKRSGRGELEAYIMNLPLFSNIVTSLEGMCI